MNQMTTHERFADQPARGDPTAILPDLSGFLARNRHADLLAIREGLRARSVRGRFFNSKLFADPAWDMLLELYAAAIIQRRFTIARLSERSGVPATTALRWIATLEQEGLVERLNDPLDRRKVFIALTEKGAEAMSGYFEEVHGETRLL